MNARCLMVSCLLLFPAEALAQSNPSASPLVSIQKHGHASVLVPADNYKDGQVEVRLSDSLLVVLEVFGAPGVAVQSLNPKRIVEGWNVRRIGNLERSQLDDGNAAKVIIRQELVLDPQKPGELLVALPAMQYRENGQTESWQTINWQPIPVRVVTVVLQPSLEELRDVAPPEDVPTDYRPINWFRWSAFVGSLLAILAICFGLRHWLHRPPNPVPPDQWALQELKRVAESDLVKSGQEDRLGAVISDVIRHYLDLRFQINASARTTNEFLANQASDGPLSIDQKQTLHELLERCDLNKFARYPFTQAESQQLIDQARRLIQQTSQEPLKPTL